MAEFQTIDDKLLTGKIALVRVDLNVPMKDGKVTDKTRLERLLPTLRDLKKMGAKSVLLSHFGRPKGQRNEDFSLRPVAEELARVMETPIAFVNDCKGDVARKAIAEMKNGEILVLENTRFYAEEEANDAAFSQELASLGDVFVNDAFSAAHRAHASTTGVTAFLPAVAGRLMQEELTALNRALENPQKPVAALVGGSKISTKLDLLRNLVQKVDLLVLGGGMANTFLAADGINVGKSLYESDMLDTARAIKVEAQKAGCTILLPRDVVIASALQSNIPCRAVPVNQVPADQMIFDIGPQAVKDIGDSLAQCRTIVWNGPLGVFETPPFDRGTNEIAVYVADLSKRGQLLSVAGGGDTVAALTHAGVAHDLSYLSTAGGAFLEWMEGKTLPGVAALKNSGVKN